jgi:hypothetical protein
MSLPLHSARNKKPQRLSRFILEPWLCGGLIPAQPRSALVHPGADHFMGLHIWYGRYV